jgi:hypothetical protein
MHIIQGCHVKYGEIVQVRICSFIFIVDLLNFQVSLMEENQWNLGADNKSLDQYIHSLQDLRTDLSAQLEDSVDRLLIKPLTEYQLLLQKVESIIKKRNNKLLDYDRNRVAHEKMTNNPARRNEMSEEKKILKVRKSHKRYPYSFLVARTSLESSHHGVRPIQQFTKS